VYYVGAILMTFILVTLYKCLIPKVALKQEAERSSGPARGIRRKKSPAHAKHSDGDGREHIRPAQPSVVSQGVLRDLRLRLSHPWNLSSIALGHLPRPIPPNVSHVLPARFVVPPFGWSGPWHPLFKSGLHSHHNLLDVEIAPKNFRPTAGRLNIKFNVVEPFTIPLIYGKLKNRDEVRKYVRKQESQWYISFTLCPYTAEWVNNMVDTVSRIPVFYPMDSKYVPEKTAKVYDIMLASSKAAAHFLKPTLDVIKQFHYVLLKKPTEGDEEPPTHPAPVSHEAKLKLYAQSKSAIVWNCYVAPADVTAEWQRMPITDHAVFQDIPRTGWATFPQLKSRTFEAAMSGTVLLAFWDRFKLIEQWFEPEVEFIYWYNVTHLHSLVVDIAANYAKYQPLAEAAQRRVLLDYTGEQFVRRYLSFLHTLKK